MTVFITGGTGFVGSNLLQRFATRDEDVIVLVRETSNERLVPDNCKTVTGDVCQPETYEHVLEKVDTVVHLAAVYQGWFDESTIERVNFQGTKQLVDASNSAGVSQFIFTSTIRAHPEIPIHPRVAYERTKVQAGEYLESFETKMAISILYPTYVFGPRDHKLNRLSYFKRAASNTLLVPPLYLPGTYNVVHVGDVVDTIFDSLRRMAEGEDELQRHIISGDNISAYDFHRRIAGVVNSRCLVVPIPKPFLRSMGRVADKLHAKGVLPFDGQQFDQTQDQGTVPTRFENRTPVEQRTLDETLKDAYCWYVENGVL